MKNFVGYHHPSLEDGNLKQIMENHFFKGTFFENHSLQLPGSKDRIFLLYLLTRGDVVRNQAPLKSGTCIV